jgi:N-acetylglucosamine-6-phosphate deacetylase
MALLALTGARIFTGETFLDGHAVLMDAGTIVGVVPGSEIPSGAGRHALDGGLLVPGFIDAQVNGGGGALFSATSDAASLGTIAAAHARHGTTAMLPTLITDTPEAMRRGIATTREAIAQGVPGIAGIHLEGPFLSKARKGAHDPNLIRAMTDADLELLLETGLRTVLMTVAPETVPPDHIAELAAHGIIVSLGHTDASYDLGMAAAAAGARGITHLYNAMSPLSHRNPGMVGAALYCGTLWCGIIADGHHVHPVALSIALRAKHGPARLFLVTDAMPTAGHADDHFTLNGRLVTRHDGLLTLEDGTLAGSDLTMDAAVRFAIDYLEVTLDEALRMASLYPAQFLKLDETYGRIAGGYRADLVHLSDALSVEDVWIGGKSIDG